jgi:DNA gyrase subunit B
MSTIDRHRLDDYTAEELQTFQPGVDHIRAHAGMYIGSSDERGLHELLWQLVRESLVEARAGFASEIWVVLDREGWLAYCDDGRGFAAIGPPDLEAAFTQWPRSGIRRFDQLAYVTANALSEWFSVETGQGGGAHELQFEQGEATGLPVTTRQTSSSGITLMFRPDPDIFGEARFNPNLIRERLREYAFLNSRVQLSFTDGVSEAKDVFAYTDGIAEYVRFLNEGQKPLHLGVFSTRGEAEGVQYELGLQWCESDECIERVFVNDLYMRQGGTPLAGLRSALTQFAKQFTQPRSPQPPIRGSHIRSGLTTVISVRLADPLFVSATRSHLGNPEVERVIAAAVGELLRGRFAANPAVVERIAQHARLEAETEAEVKKSRKLKPR